MTCKHEIWEMDTAAHVDGLCPLCLRAENYLQRKEINRLRYSLAPFAKNVRAKSLMAALDHISREDLIQAAEVLAATDEANA